MKKTNKKEMTFEQFSRAHKVISKKALIIGSICAGTVALGGAGAGIYFGVTRGTKSNSTSISCNEAYNWLKDRVMSEDDLKLGSGDASEVIVSWDFSKSDSSLIEKGGYDHLFYEQLIKPLSDTEITNKVKSSNVKANDTVKKYGKEVDAVVLYDFGGVEENLRKRNYLFNVPADFTIKKEDLNGGFATDDYSNFELENDILTFTKNLHTNYLPNGVSTEGYWGMNPSYYNNTIISVDSKGRAVKVTLDVYSADLTSQLEELEWGSGRLIGNATFDIKY